MKIKETPEILEENGVTTLEELLNKLSLNSEDEYVPINQNGEMTKELTEIIYYYRYETKVIVEHIDQSTGEKILEKVTDETTGKEEFKDSSVEIQGCEGDSYIAKNKKFEDYELVQEPTNKTGIMTKEEITVKYYYLPKVKVIEKHVDIMTDKLLEEETIYNGKEGETYKTQSKEFENYDLVTVEKYYDKHPENKEELTTENKDKTYLPENSEGTMTVERNEDGTIKNNTITITYYYVKKTCVKVKYLEKETNEEIVGEITINGHEGDKYQTYQLNITGYKFIESTSNTSGNMTVDPIIEVIYYYEKTESDTQETTIINNTTINNTTIINNNTEIINNEGSSEAAPATTIVISDSSDTASNAKTTTDSTKNTTSSLSLVSSTDTTSSKITESTPSTGDNAPIIALGVIAIIIITNGVQIVISRKKNKIDRK